MTDVTLNYKITGRILEAESHLGVKGLIVRAYDKDLIFDDLLGNTVTDGDGRFEILYSKKDFQECLEGTPDIYIAVFGSPGRRLLDTKDTTRRHATRNEHFELTIDRDTLGEYSPNTPQDRIIGQLALSGHHLKIETVDRFSSPRILGYAVGGIPGEPALPRKIYYLILPLKGDIQQIEVFQGDPLSFEAPPPLPAQEPVFYDWHSPDAFKDGMFDEDFDISFTEPNKAVYERSALYPEKLVEILSVEEMRYFQIVAVSVQPLRYDFKNGCFLLYPNLNYQVKFDREKADAYTSANSSKFARIEYHQAEVIKDIIALDQVSVAPGITWPLSYYFGPYPHVIITDNYRWPEAVDRGDGTTRCPVLAERGPAIAGNMVSEFSKLTAWKTDRGVRSRVVTISDIVDGKFGDFTENGFARDLQEVIRNFIKYACENWDTLYVLLGGDLAILPMRRLAGLKRMETVQDSYPKEGKVSHKPNDTFSKIRFKDPFGANNLITTDIEGVLIPYDREAGSGRLGWYHTTEEDFKTKTEGFCRLPASTPTKYLIAEGPASVLNRDLCWITNDVNIPSDFYYSSLFASFYGKEGIHDFDSNNNGIYGQYKLTPGKGRKEGDPIENFKLSPDVYVGRAPVNNQSEAEAFVDKVITYESLKAPDGSLVNSEYLRKMVFVAHYWIRNSVIKQADTSTPPSHARFTYKSGDAFAKIHTHNKLNMSVSYRLVSQTGAAHTHIDYDESASATNPGWFFVTNDNYNQKSTNPTHFIKVFGSPATIDPDRFVLDPVVKSGCTEEKERLYEYMKSWYPEFTDIERHYMDYFEFNTPPLPIPFITASNLIASLNNGAHFLSLSGHGGASGCCGLSLTNTNFSNTSKYFIVYANSCTTAKPDGSDSLGERLVKDSNSGAVGYVGMTRGGWVGIGDDYEDFFWCATRTCKRLGPAANFRHTLTGIQSWWTVFAQNLFGDPEMPIWQDVPLIEIPFTIEPKEAKWGGIFAIKITDAEKYGTDLKVTVIARSDRQPEPLFLETCLTDQNGRATFNLPNLDNTPDQVQVSVTQCGRLTSILHVPVSRD